jgi:hypothetical protein
MRNSKRTKQFCIKWLHKICRYDIVICHLLSTIAITHDIDIISKLENKVRAHASYVFFLNMS